MLSSTHFQTRPLGESLRLRDVNREADGGTRVLGRCLVSRPATDNSAMGWEALPSRTMRPIVCLDAPKPKSKLKTKANVGLGRGPFD